MFCNIPCKIVAWCVFFKSDYFICFDICFVDCVTVEFYPSVILYPPVQDFALDTIMGLEAIYIIFLIKCMLRLSTECGVSHCPM